jgi:hypothetical protein
MPVRTHLRIRTRQCVHWLANRDERLVEGGETVTVPQHTRAGMHTSALQALEPARVRTQASQRLRPAAAKDQGWWAESALDRHAYIYPVTAGR